MKSVTFLHLLIWQKVTYFALHFQLYVLYCNRNYMIRLLSLRETFWHAKHVCRLCICLSHIWRVMTFLHLLIWQKVSYFALPFQLCVLYCNKIYLKRLLSQRRSFWYAKHVCRCCISLFDIWKVMTFLYLEIWQKMTYFSLYFQLCALYCNRNYMKRLLSLRETFWYAKYVCRLCICLSHNMKSDDIFTSPNMAKSELFCLAFSVVCVVLQQNIFEKIALTEKKLLICKTCL